MSEANKALVRILTDEVWNARRVERIPELYAPDYVADYRPIAPLQTGHDGIRGMVERAWQTFPDYHEELHELVAEGDLVTAWITISGTQDGPWGIIPPTGRRVAFDEILLLRIAGGRVVWQRGIPDNVAALRQMGILPTPPA